jgi:uncharacterized repeat protein (TIGR03806 family)
MNRRPRWLTLSIGGLLGLAMGSCDAPDPGRGPRYLSEWDLFSDPENQVPVDGVVPYAINAPLFSDHASKHRFIRLPEGGTITLDAAGHYVFPEGTVLIKTFGFLTDERDPSLGERLLETRLLVLEEAEWVPYVYLWNADESDAELELAGDRIDVAFIDAAGESVAINYRVPTATQCANCHGGVGEIAPLGPRLDQMDHLFDYGAGPVNQVDYMASLGMFAATPPAAAERRTLAEPTDTTAPLDARARAYLHANCGHCHREDGAARQSGLWLNIEETDPSRLGICKPPAAAGRGTGGRSVAVWPGSSELSIMTFRMASEEPGVKMPELPTVLSHAEGVALITEWIDAMEPVDCDGP